MRLHIFFHSYMPCRIPAMLYRHIGEILNAKQQSVKHYPLDNQCVTRAAISYKEICVFAGCGVACAPMCGACRCRFFLHIIFPRHICYVPREKRMVVDFCVSVFILHIAPILSGILPRDDKY